MTNTALLPPPFATCRRGDCKAIPLPDRSVDLVVCSPPYEDARTYGIGFGFKGAAWVEWALPRYMECLRISRGLVVWIVNGKTEDYRWSASPVMLMADLHRAGAFLRKPPIFHRVGIPGSGRKDWLRDDYEFAICATARRGKLPWSDNTAMGHPPKWGPGGEMSNRLSSGRRVNQWGPVGSPNAPRRRNGQRGARERPSHVVMTAAEASEVATPGADNPFRSRRLERGNEKGSAAVLPVLANPGNVIRCIVGGGAMGSKLAHENEAPYPERLCEFFIRSFCPPGGTVCDPFSGSGTTMAAAIKAGRNGVAFDIRASQVKLTQRRINEALASLPASGGAA